MASVVFLGFASCLINECVDRDGRSNPAADVVKRLVERRSTCGESSLESVDIVGVWTDVDTAWAKQRTILRVRQIEYISILDRVLAKHGLSFWDFVAARHSLARVDGIVPQQLNAALTSEAMILSKLQLRIESKASVDDATYRKAIDYINSGKHISAGEEATAMLMGFNAIRLERP